MAATTSFHAEKCRHLVSAYAAAFASSWSIAHSYLFRATLCNKREVKFLFWKFRVFEEGVPDHRWKHHFIGSRACSVAGPKTWNALLEDVTSSQTPSLNTPVAASSKRGFSSSLFPDIIWSTDCILTFSLDLCVPTLRRVCRSRYKPYERYDMIWYVTFVYTYASLTSFEFHHLWLVDFGGNERLAIKQAQPSSDRSYAVRVDNVCLERTSYSSSIHKRYDCDEVKGHKVKQYYSPEQVISEPWGVTHQCYLPTNTSERVRLTPSKEVGTRFTYPGGMEGWVDLGDWSHTHIPARRWSSVQVLTRQRTVGCRTRNLSVTSPMP